MAQKIRFRGDIHRFPDHFTDEQISKALSEYYGLESSTQQQMQMQQQQQIQQARHNMIQQDAAIAQMEADRIQSRGIAQSIYEGMIENMAHSRSTRYLVSALNGINTGLRGIIKFGGRATAAVTSLGGLVNNEWSDSIRNAADEQLAQAAAAYDAIVPVDIRDTGDTILHFAGTLVPTIPMGGKAAVGLAGKLAARLGKAAPKFLGGTVGQKAATSALLSAGTSMLMPEEATDGYGLNVLANMGIGTAFGAAIPLGLGAAATLGYGTARGLRGAGAALTGTTSTPGAQNMVERFLADPNIVGTRMSKALHGKGFMDVKMNDVRNDLIEYARAKDLFLTTGQITDSGFMQRVEALAMTSPWTRTVENMDSMFSDTMAKLMRNLANDAGAANASYVSAGQKLRSSLSAARNEFKQSARDNYKIAEDIMKKQKTVVDISDFYTGTLRPLYEQLKRTPIELQANSQLYTLLDKLDRSITKRQNGYGMPSLFVRLNELKKFKAIEADEILTALKHEGRKFVKDDKMKSQINKTIKDLTERIDSVAPKELAAGRRDWTEYWNTKEFMDGLFPATQQKGIWARSGEPARVATSFLGADGTNIETLSTFTDLIKKARKSYGLRNNSVINPDLGDTVLQDIGAAWLDSFVRTATRHGGWQKSQTHLTQYKVLDNETKSMFFRPEIIDDLNKMVLIEDMFERVISASAAVGASQGIVASVGRVIAALTTAWLTNPHVQTFLTGTNQARTKALRQYNAATLAARRAAIP